MDGCVDGRMDERMHTSSSGRVAAWPYGWLARTCSAVSSSRRRSEGGCSCCRRLRGTPSCPPRCSMRMRQRCGGEGGGGNTHFSILVDSSLNACGGAVQTCSFLT
eukprot:364823-Chlamydomonas_euryale.AAC.5